MGSLCATRFLGLLWRERAELVAFRIGHDGPPESAIFTADFFQRAGAESNQAVHLRRIGHIDIDVHAVLTRLRLGYAAEPDAQAAFGRLNTDRVVRLILRWVPH